MIIRQVEYYFGDFNLPRDKFLQEETKSDDGWVTMETMLKFKRLSELSKDEKVIVDALKQSKAGLLEVSEDGSKIRRDPAIPLPENTEESRSCWRPGLLMPKDSTKRQPYWTSCWTTTTR